MMAQEIKAGMTYTIKAGEKLVGGWRATGDAVVKGNKVLVPVKNYSGEDGAREFDLNHQIPMDKSPRR